MALLDVSNILLDPDFTDVFAVKRREEKIDNYGRVTTNDLILGGIVGVITSSSPNDLDRKTDYEAATRNISVVCRFRLRGETNGYQPDVVVWHGNNYVVRQIDVYPQFGSGFIQATCESMDRQDNALDTIKTGQLAFNDLKNSGGLALCY